MKKPIYIPSNLRSNNRLTGTFRKKKKTGSSMSVIMSASAFYLNTQSIPIRSLSSVAAAAPESGTELAVLMGEIEDRLRQVGRLHDAADLDSSLILNELAHQVKQIRREL